MTLQDIKITFSYLIQSVRGKQTTKSVYPKYLLIVLCSLLGVGIIFVGYRWYRVSREQETQRVFAERMQDLAMAMQGSKDDLEQVQTGLQLAYQQNSNSSLAPYFLGMQAEALVQDGQMEKATQVLDQMIASMSTDSPLVDLYKTKKALINLDSQDDSMKNQGLTELESLAQQENNQYRDLALFYLGRYYWTEDNLNEAKKYFENLVDLDSNNQNIFPEKYQPSPWAQQAETYLREIA